jgi:phage replication O-like protein O
VARLLIPNTTQVPNVVLDEVIPRLKPGAVRVLLVIVRFTYGFGKEADRISYTQLQKVTGLSREGVRQAVKELGELVTVKPGARGKGANEYSLNINISTGELVRKLDQSEKLTMQVGSQKSRPFQTQSKPTPLSDDKGPSFRKAKNPDPRIKPLIDCFGDKFQKATGKPYLPTWAKDGHSLRRLLSAGATPEEIEHVMSLYFADDFANKTGFDIGRFCSAFNSLNSAKGVARDRSSTSVTPPEGKYAAYR